MKINRADRRRQQREAKKTVDTEIVKYRKLFSKFNNDDFNLIENVIENRVADVLEESSYILDMIYSAKLIDLGLAWEEVEEFSDEISQALEEDGIAIQKLKMKLGKEYEKEMAKISAEIEKRIRELIESKVNKKEAIEVLLEENPLLTKSMLTNAYSRVNAEIKKQQANHGSEEDPEVKDAAEKIINIIEEDKEMNNKSSEETKNEVVVSGATATPANLSPQSKGLKIKSMVVEGENGTYTVCENGVELRNAGLMMFFENLEQLETFAKEYKEVFNMI